MRDALSYIRQTSGARTLLIRRPAGPRARADDLVNPRARASATLPWRDPSLARMVALGGALALAGGSPDARPDTRDLPIARSCRCSRSAAPPPPATACAGMMRRSGGLFVASDGDGRLTERDAVRRGARPLTPEVPALVFVPAGPLARAEGGGPHAEGRCCLARRPGLLAIERWIESERRPGLGGGGEGSGARGRRAESPRGAVRPRGLPSWCSAAISPAATRATIRTTRSRRPRSDLRSLRAARGARRRRLDAQFVPLGRRRDALADPRKAWARPGGLGTRQPDTFFPEARGLRSIGRSPDDPPLDPAEREAMGIEDGRAPTALVWVRAPVAPRAPYRSRPRPEEATSSSRLGRSPASPEPHRRAASRRTGEIRDPAVSPTRGS